MVGDAGDKPLQLREFLMESLNNPANKNIIAWTGRGRFKIIDPDEVSSLNLNLFMTIYGEIFKIKNKKNKTLIDYYI